MMERESKRRRRRRRREREDGSGAVAAAPFLRAAASPVRRFAPGGGGGGRSTICATPFFAAAACREVVALCEAHAADSGWSKELAVRYPQTTTDLEVDRVPALRRWLCAANLTQHVGAHFAAAHGRELHALDDLFVIKYDARGGGEQCELLQHRDAGDLSFMVALSARSDFTGGGTHFPELGELVAPSGGDGGGVVHLEQGELLSFDADLVHSGVPIGSGVRYLLVGFCHCSDPAAATEPGNICCDTLEMIAADEDGQDTVVPEPVAVVRQRALRAEAVATLRADALNLHTISTGGVAAVDETAAPHAREAEHVDAGASYWVGATATPRTALEKFALEVLAMHIPTAVDAADAGAEFWVQRFERRARESSATKSEMEEEEEEEEDADSLPFHFDKDEVALRERGVWRHPACATVTYLSAARRGDLPTVIFDSVQVQQAEEEGNGSAAGQQQQQQPRQACISYPSEGKHLAFRGKYLHGCPLELAHTQPQDKADLADDSVGRLTLLVNLWTKGTKPAGLRPLPATVAAQLSRPAAIESSGSTLNGIAQWSFLRPGDKPEQLRMVVANSRQRGGVGPAVSLCEHVEGMTAPLPVAAVAAAQAESSCLCMFV
jgi:hypothetical protein